MLTLYDYRTIIVYDNRIHCRTIFCTRTKPSKQHLRFEKNKQKKTKSDDYQSNGVPRSPAPQRPVNAGMSEMSVGNFVAWRRFARSEHTLKICFARHSTET